MPRNLTTLLTALLVAVVPSSHAQSARPQFEVASVKRNTSGLRSGVPLSTAGGRFVAHNSTLQTLIRWTYRSGDGKTFRPGEVVGLPGWAATDGFDIEAKADGENPTLPLEDVRLMSEAMLQDRFQLKSHRETHELPIYALVVVKPGKIQLSDDQSPPGPPPPFTGERVTGLSPRGVIGFSTSSLVARSISLSGFADFLNGFLDKRVYDKTGVGGLVDIKMQWSPDTALVTDATAASTAPTAGRPQFFGPSFLSGMPDQLGLKLESTRGPVEVLVVDAVSRPSEN